MRKARIQRSATMRPRRPVPTLRVLVRCALASATQPASQSTIEIETTAKSNHAHGERSSMRRKVYARRARSIE